MTDPRPLPAHRLRDGALPPLLFLPGYASDMSGTKALALDAWAARTGHALARFDYAGCGASAGDFATQTLTGWRDDALAMLDLLATPAVLVGSSMGGWIALMLARDHPDKVAGLVLVAPAPDFTDWGFTLDEKMTILTTGRLEKPSRWSDEPTVTTRAFWASGEASRLTAGPLAIDCPVRILHGQADADVPWHRSPHLAGLIRSADVQTWLVKDGDHRLSREPDLALLVRAVEDVMEVSRAAA